MQYLEHKIVQFANDTNVCVSSISSLNEPFLVSKEYEKVKNAKVNVDNTEALWVRK